jgi:prepilin-type N-terminal cleavage/methylation domain-containing protein
MNQIKRGAFTMIELIFVIVIIGILAAVAVPKLMETVGEAEKAPAIAMLSDMKRIYVPAVWSKVRPSSGKNCDWNNADLNDSSNNSTKGLLSYFSEVPNAYACSVGTGCVGSDNNRTVNWTKCADSTATLGGTTGLLIDSENSALKIFCKQPTDCRMEQLQIGFLRNGKLTTEPQ